MRFLLVALSGVAVWWTLRQHRTSRQAAVPRALAVFAAAALIEHLFLLLAALGLSGPVGGLVGIVAAAMALLLWTALSWLIGLGTRRRDLFARIPLLAIAGIIYLSGHSDSANLAAGVAVAASVSFRWKNGLSTGTLFKLGLAALALAVLLTLGPAGTPQAHSGLDSGLIAYARAIHTLAVFYALCGALAVLARFVGDPSLGIRRVSRRLALSHVLVVTVPVILILALWLFTTFLGVSNDRALTAARAIESRADQLASAVRAALAEPTKAQDRLQTLAELHAANWPSARIWLRAGHGFERLRGDSLPHERFLAGWADSAGLRVNHRSIRSKGVLDFAGSLFLAATARSARDTTVAAVVLIPIDTLFLDPVGRTVGARLAFNRNVRVRTTGVGVFDDDESAWPGDVTADDSLAAGGITGSDSAGLERARRVTRLLGIPDSAVQVEQRSSSPRLTISGGSGTAVQTRFDLASLASSGRTLVPGIAHRSRGWDSRELMLTAAIDPTTTLSGIFQFTTANPLGVLPLLLLVLAGALFGLVTLFNLAMVGNMGRSITQAIGALRIGASRLQAGDLAHRIEVRGRDDLWDVADAFNHAAEGLERAHELEKERDRRENELGLARRIQARLLPAGPPDIPGLDIAGVYEPAREIGGDYYDHIPLGGGRVLLVIADVSGKSVPAALLMSGFRASLVSQDLSEGDPAGLALRLNGFLHRSVEPGKFVTAFVGFLDGGSGQLVYANAGHNPPVLLRADDSFEMLARGGTMLGILPESLFESGEARLAPGDLLAMYTDGVTEGMAASGELWGEERLMAALRRGAGIPCGELAGAVAAEVRAFEGAQGPADDITLLLARRT